MALIISALLFMLLMLSISLYGYRRYARPGRFYEQLGTELISVSHPDIDPITGLVVRVVKTIGEKVPISPDSASSTRRELLAAGYRSDSAPLVFYGAKVLFCSAMILLAFVAGDYLFANPLHRILFTALGGFIGYFAPSLILERMVTNRQERLRLALPDALDVLVLSVEAGLGLDQALQYVSREMVISNKELADELSLVTLEMRAGAAGPKPCVTFPIAPANGTAEARRDPHPDRPFWREHGGITARPLRFHARATPSGCRRARRKSRGEAGISDLPFHPAFNFRLCGLFGELSKTDAHSRRVPLGRKRGLLNT